MAALDAYLVHTGSSDESDGQSSSSSTGAPQGPQGLQGPLPNLVAEFRRELESSGAESEVERGEAEARRGYAAAAGSSAGYGSSEDYDGDSGSSWSDSVSGVVIPGRHVRGRSLRRPQMPDWSPSSSGTDVAAAGAAAAAAAAPLSADSAASSGGPTSQSPIRRKRQSSGRRSRSRGDSAAAAPAASRRELPVPGAAGQADVEVSPRVLEFGSVVQWCRQTRTVSVHNPSSFTARLHGGIVFACADGAGPKPFHLRLAGGWPTLPPMSTVALQVRMRPCACAPLSRRALPVPSSSTRHGSLLLTSAAVHQVEMTPSTVGPCAATLVVHATTEGAGSAHVAVVCDLRGDCTKPPLHLAIEPGEGGSELRLRNVSAEPTALLVTCDEPFSVTQPSALTLHPGELHVSAIERQLSRNGPVTGQESWLTVHDQTNANTHRLVLCAAPHSTGTVATGDADRRSESRSGRAQPSALADSISARATAGTDRRGIVGVDIKVEIEVHNAHSLPVRLAPRLTLSPDVAGHEQSAAMVLKLSEPVAAAPSAPSTFVVCLCAAQAGTHAVALQLLCVDESSVVVPLSFEVEHENWTVDGESDGLDFGTVDGHGTHFLSTQVHNRSSVPTSVKIFIEEDANDGATASQCFSAAIERRGEGAGDEVLCAVKSGDVVQLPPCSANGGSVAIHVRFDPPNDTGRESLVEYCGSLRLESLSSEEETKAASLRLHAQVGTSRLQVPGGEQLLLFCVDSPTAEVCSQHLSLRNYGNVEASCELDATNESFCVEPQSFVIAPSEVVEVTVSFAAGITSVDSGHELVPDTITGHLNVNTQHLLFQIPLRAEIRTHPHLVCSAPVVNWGCVDVGSTQRQSIIVRNRSGFKCEIFAAIADLDGLEQSRPNPFSIEGAEIVQLNAHSGHELVLTFSPTDVSFVRHGLFIRDKFGRTYKIPLLGAGGKSHFTLELERGQRVLDFTSAARVQKTLRLHNSGTRTGFVHVDCTSANGDVVVLGTSGNAASVVVAPNKSHEFVLECSQSIGDSNAFTERETALDIYCGDELARRRRRQCRHTRWAEDLGFSGFSPGRDVFDDTFCQEEFFVEPTQQGGVASAHEDTMFDDYFDEPIFEAQLKRLSVPLIVASAPENATPAVLSEGTIHSAASNVEAEKDQGQRLSSRSPLGERLPSNISEHVKPAISETTKGALGPVFHSL
jgi:hypothetical protein